MGVLAQHPAGNRQQATIPLSLALHQADDQREERRAFNKFAPMIIWVCSPVAQAGAQQI